MAVHTQSFGPPEPPGLKELFYFIRKGSLKIATRSFINLTFLCPPKTYPKWAPPGKMVSTDLVEKQAVISSVLPLSLWSWMCPGSSLSDVGSANTTAQQFRPAWTP